MQAPDYPHGLPADYFDLALLAVDPDAVELGYDALAVLGPSVAADHAFRAWWDRAGNLGATPAMAKAVWDDFYRNDVRHLLPEVTVPTLVIQTRRRVR